MDSEMEIIRRQNRDNLQRHGTDVDYNDRDVTGDGDQSPIPPDDKEQRYYRSLWSEGGDIMDYIQYQFFSPFAKVCILGDVTTVRQMLKEADTDPERPSSRLIQLLESRETCMRLSPILMLVSVVRHFEYATVPKNICQLVEVAKLLIKYGGKLSMLLMLFCLL